MVLLKEDGSLDMERINKLPINEWMNLMGDLTDEQFKEYQKKCPINEGLNSVMIHESNCTMEEDMEKAGFIKATDMINNLKKKYGIT